MHPWEQQTTIRGLPGTEENYFCSIFFKHLFALNLKGNDNLGKCESHWKDINVCLISVSKISLWVMAHQGARFWLKFTSSSMFASSLSLQNSTSAFQSTAGSFLALSSCCVLQDFCVYLRPSSIISHSKMRFKHWAKAWVGNLFLVLFGEIP